MGYLFEGNTASDVWNSALAEIQYGENCRRQPGRGGVTHEIDQVLFNIHNPRQRWVVNRQPPLNPAFAIAEVIWILTGRNDAAFLNFWNSRLPNYAGAGDCYHGAYGFRLRHHFGLDQLEQAYSVLRNNPDSRQVVLQIWDTTVDFPDVLGQPVNQDIPCNILALLKIRDDKLNWTQIVRSNDLFKGVPYNFVQFTCLQEVLAGWLGVGPGAYHHLSDSLHLYEQEFEQVFTDLGDEVHPNTDSLAWPKDISDKAFMVLGQLIEHMITANLSQKELVTIVNYCDLPDPFKNMLRVLAAELARRKGWLDIAQNITHTCNNPVLVQLIERWFTRVLQNVNIQI